jgi:peptidoglycan/LPS O-acetylase OafA/YrhL
VSTNAPKLELRQTPALDGLRGVAIALVLTLHSGYGLHFLGGGLGVDVFFVLSGFLITTLLLDERRRSGRIDLRAFYVRRVARLYPALVLMIVAAVLSSATLPKHTLGGVLLAALAVLTYTANLVASVSAGGLDGLDHTWTLSLEEQFYLFWPAGLLLVARLRTRTAVLVTLGATAASWASLVLWPGRSIGGIPQAYFRPDSRVGGLLLGCALAFVLTWVDAPRLAARRVVGIGSLAGLALVVVAAGHGSVDYLRECVPAASVFSAALIAHLVSGGESVVGRLLAWPPLRWLGVISYGTYLYSGLINSATANAVASWPLPAVALLRTGAAIVAATVSFGLVERPLRARARRWLATPGRQSGTSEVDVLVVCTANVCRSPYIASRLMQALPELEIATAGTAPTEGLATDPRILERLRSRGCPIPEVRPQPLTRAQVREARLVIGAAHEHRLAAVALDSDADARAFTLKELARYGAPLAAGSGLLALIQRVSEAAHASVDEHDDDLADPYGSDDETYDQLERDVDAALAVLVPILRASA